MSRTVFLALLLQALPASAAAQSPEQQIQATLQRAVDAGVPVALLESKVAEGRAKGVPLDRIAVALAQRLETLETVHTQLRDADLDEAELGLAADAVQAGTSIAALQRLTSVSPRDRRGPAVAALSQLVQLGYASDDALQQVMQALRGGPGALINLPAQAAAARARTPAGGRPGGPPAGAGPASSAQGRGGPPGGVPPRGKPERRRGPPPGRGQA